MTTHFNQEILKVVVAQICQVVGFQGVYTVPLEVLVDILQRYIFKIAYTAKNYAEHCGRTIPCLSDVNLSFRDMGISISDLEDYVNHVEPFQFPHNIPKLPVARPSNMNFLKPGSKETLSRPIHIHEHLPPMFPEKEEEDANLSTNGSFDEEQVGGIHSPWATLNEKIFGDAEESTRPRINHEEEGQPVREIDSVMMTTSGFISSARAGKLPEARRPNIGQPSKQTDHSSLKKRATMEKIIRHKSQLVGIQPGPLAKPRPDTKLKPKLPGAPPGTGSIKVGKVAPILKMPTPKKMEESVDKDVERKRRDKRDEHRHKDRRRDRGRNKDKEKYRGRMRMRGLSKEEELRRYKEREQELIAALAASASVTVTSIPPPSLRVREKTPEKGSPGKVSPDDNKLTTFNKVKVKELPEKLQSPSNLIDIQNIKEEKPDEDEYVATPPTYMGFDQGPLPLTPETPGKVFSQRHIEETKKKSKPRNPSSRPSRRHSKSSSRRRKNVPTESPTDYTNKNMEASLDKSTFKSPQRDYLTFPNAPSHIPSFSSFSYPHYGPPQADVKPFSNIYPEQSFNSSLPVDESVGIVGIPPEQSDFKDSLGIDNSFTKECQDPVPNVTPSLPKLEKKKEHKKDKKSKDRDAEREKAKKKKKDKERAKEEKKKEKERLKEEKRRKKKVKEEACAIPKLTLKLQTEELPPPQQVEKKATPKLVIKPVVKRPEEVSDARPHYSVSAQKIDEPGSPEIAKLTALITRPSKSLSKKHTSSPTVPPLKIKGGGVKKSEKREKRKRHLSDAVRKSSPPSVSPFRPSRPTEITPQKPSKRHASSSSAIVTETVGPIGCFKDDLGNQVWICPTCGKQDDGSPMIGCDTCDDWYHWVCVGIQVAPNENVNWYCPRCISHQKHHGSGEKKKRGRKRKLV